MNRYKVSYGFIERRTVTESHSGKTLKKPTVKHHWISLSEIIKAENLFVALKDAQNRARENGLEVMEVAELEE